MPSQADPFGTYEVVLIVDPRSRLAHGTHIAYAPLDDAEIRSTLESTLRHPMAARRPLRPGRVCTGSERVARAIRPVADRYGFELVTDQPLETLPEVAEFMCGWAPKTPFDEVLPCAHELHAVAERLAAVAPWTVLTEREPLYLVCEESPLDYPMAVVIGAGGEAEGIAFYRRGTNPWSSDIARRDSLALIFERDDEIEEGSEKLFRRLGYNRNDLYPNFVRVRPDREPEYPTPDEARQLLLALEAVASFFEAHKDDIDWRTEAIANEISLDTARVSVTLAPPLDALDEYEPDLDWEDPPLLDTELAILLTDLPSSFVDACLMAVDLTPEQKRKLAGMRDGVEELPALVVKGRKQDVRRAARSLYDIDTLAFEEQADHFRVVAHFGRERATLLKLSSNDPGARQEIVEWCDRAAANGDQALFVLSGGGARRSPTTVRTWDLVELIPVNVVAPKLLAEPVLPGRWVSY